MAIMFTSGRFVSKGGEVRFSVGTVLGLLVVLSFGMCEAEVRGGVSSRFIPLGSESEAPWFVLVFVPPGEIFVLVFS